MSVKSYLEGKIKGKQLNESSNLKLSKDEFESRKEKFLNAIKSKLVKLDDYKSEYNESDGFNYWKLSFQVIFDLNDEYIDNDNYSKGEAYIYPSDKLYNDIDKKAKELFGDKVNWNNTSTIGWVIGH